MANLSITILKKRVGRIETFLAKLARNDSFTTKSGQVNASILIHYKGKNIFASYNVSKKNEYERALNSLNTASSGSDKFFISDVKNTFTIPLTDIVKTGEFGGKIEGSLQKEKQAIIDLRASLNAAISDNGGPINIKIENKIIKNIVDVEKTSGSPKSDFHLINSDGKIVIWISHKDGSKPSDFQQWGGISQKVEPSIFSHSETQKFIKDVKKKYPNGLPPATTLYRKIKDNKLKMLSVYGNRFGTTAGEQNVSVLLQGKPGLSKSGTSYVLTANHVHYNGDSVDADGFEPVFMAVYKGDRSDAGIRGTRLSISPLLSRKGSEFP